MSLERQIENLNKQLGKANNLLIAANLANDALKIENVLYKDTYQNLITDNLTKADKITALKKSIVNLAALFPDANNPSKDVAEKEYDDEYYYYFGHRIIYKDDNESNNSYNGSRNVDTNRIEKYARKPETLQSGSVFKIPRSKTTRSISVDRAVKVKTKKLRSHASKKSYRNSPPEELLPQ
jgi:hypothetical protein